MTTISLDGVRTRIDHHGIYRVKPGLQRLPGKAPNSWYSWQFYLRRVLYDPACLRTIVDALAERLDLSYTQLGACEDAGVCLATALSLRTGVSMFSIKKRRKDYGLLNFTEGPILDRPVLLVDDVSGSQTTLRRAAHFIKLHLNLPPAGQYAVVVNKDVATHTGAYLDGPTLVSLFDASEFALTWDDYYARYGVEPVFGRFV